MGLIDKFIISHRHLFRNISEILGITAGITLAVWTLIILFQNYGVWTIFVGIICLPITLLSSIFVVWIITDYFPFTMLIPYIAFFISIRIAILTMKKSNNNSLIKKNSD